MKARTLQQLVVVVGAVVSVATFAGTPPAGIDASLPGTRIRLADTSGPAGRRTYVALRDGDDSLATPDPRVTGATAYIGRVGIGEVTALELPASGWTATGPSPTTFKFKSSGGTVVSARLLAGHSVRFSAYGDDAYPLDGTPQGGVGVIVVVGDVRFCGFFGGVITKDDGKKFLAVRAPAPSGCPVLGTTTSTSSSTSSSTTSTSTSTTTFTTTTLLGLQFDCFCNWRDPSGVACGGDAFGFPDCGVACPAVPAPCSCTDRPDSCPPGSQPVPAFEECSVTGPCQAD